MATSLILPTSYGDANEARAYEGSLTRLNSGSAANVATLDIVLTSYLRFPILKLFVYNYTAATSTSFWELRISTDAGATYIATNYWVALSQSNSNSSTTSTENSEAATGAIMNSSITASSTEADYAEITLFNLNDATYKPQLMFLANAWSSATHAQPHYGICSHNTAELVNAVRLLQTAGNIVSINWILAGMSA